VNCKVGLSPEFPSDTDGSSTVNPPSSSMIVPLVGHHFGWIGLR
jgi:hypothetical protein